MAARRATRVRPAARLCCGPPVSRSVASALAFSVYIPLVRAIGPARAAYSGVLVPIIAMSLSTLFEDYLWTPLAAIGALLALVGMVFALTGRRKLGTAADPA